MAVNFREILIGNKTIGVDPIVDAILTEGSPESLAYAQVVEIRKSPLKRMYIEACLLGTTDFIRISEILELDVVLVGIYSAVFYETNGLDKLSKLELLSVEDRQEKLLKIWALNQGIEFIAWRLGVRTDINPIEGLQELFSTAMYKAKEACFSGNASEESKEAVKWSKMSMDLARLLKVYTSDTGSAKKELEIALEEVSSDFPGFADLNM